MGHREEAATLAAAGANEFLTFRLGEEEYGIDILRVREIRGCDAVTRIANAPAYLLGVVNLRGIIVPIVDLRLQFRLAEAKRDASTVVIILNLAERLVGVVVDSVSDVITLGADQMKPAPEFGASMDTRYITGLGSVDGRMLILLDIETLVAASFDKAPA